MNTVIGAYTAAFLAILHCQYSSAIVYDTNQPTPKIDDYDIKYAAFLYDSDNKEVDCGGIIIHKKWILTAAHCIQAKDQSSRRVIVGVKKYNDQTPKHEIKAVYSHPQFTPDQGEGLDYRVANYDVGLVELVKELNLGPNQPIKAIPIGYTIKIPGEVCHLMGFGSINADFEPNLGELRVCNFHAWPMNMCLQQWGQKQMDTQFCVISPDRQCTVCDGDSGSALICNGQVKGVLSSGTCQVKRPTLISKLSTVADFIKKHTGL